MYIYTKFFLRDLWNTLDVSWKHVLADNLDLKGYFSGSDLEYISTLSELDLSHSEITDLTPLYYLNHFESIDISYTKIADLAPIKNLNKLKRFSAVHTRAISLAPLAHQPYLEVLDLSYPVSRLHHWSALQSLSNLKELYCNGCDLTCLDWLPPNCNLSAFSLFFNPLKSEVVSRYRKKHPFCKVLH